MAKPRGADLRALIRQHGNLDTLPRTGRRLLDELLEDRLVKLRASHEAGMDPNAAQVSYQRAEELAIAVVAGTRLTRRDLIDMDLLLRNGSFIYGYWGPIKRILKAIDPLVAPKSFGAAIARLTGGEAREPSATRYQAGSFEYSHHLREHRRVASGATLHYLSRRVVRQLQRLGSSHPQTYVDVCLAMLATWDGRVTSRAFVPA